MLTIFYKGWFCSYYETLTIFYKKNDREGRAFQASYHNLWKVTKFSALFYNLYCEPVHWCTGWRLVNGIMPICIVSPFNIFNIPLHIDQIIPLYTTMSENHNVRRTKIRYLWTKIHVVSVGFRLDAHQHWKISNQNYVKILLYSLFSTVSKVAKEPDTHKKT
jgi:hypothetical protein